MKRSKGLFVYEYLSGGGPMETAGAPDAANAELLADGLRMRDALVADLLALEDYELSVATSARATPVPEPATPLTPRLGESAYTFVARQAALHDLVWIIAPETGGLLGQFCHIAGPARWIGCRADAIRLTSGKRATLTHLAAAGVLTPLAFDRDPAVTRWVVKPDDGAGAVATRVHRSSAAAWADWSLRSPNSAMTLEPWVDGEALSVSLMCGAGGSEMLSINRQQIVVDAGGSVAFAGVEVDAVRRDDPRHALLQRWATQVAAAIPGLFGFVGLDLVWHAARGPVLIEVNPRVTCAYAGLSSALGRNLAADAIRHHEHGAWRAAA